MPLAAVVFFAVVLAVVAALAGGGVLVALRLGASSVEGRDRPRVAAFVVGAALWLVGLSLPGVLAGLVLSLRRAFGGSDANQASGALATGVLVTIAALALVVAVPGLVWMSRRTRAGRGALIAVLVAWVVAAAVLFVLFVGAR